jgi:hypothetical protein
MKKLLLLSVIIASIVIPVRAARMKDPRKGLRATVVRTTIFNAIYVALLLFVWHRL